MTRASRVWIGWGLGLALALTARADPKELERSHAPTAAESEPNPDSSPDTSETSERMPIFVPRDTGAPQTRVGGATRGIELRDLPSLRALVPAELGHTLEAQPTLYWHLSGPTEHRIDLTLIAEGAGPSDPLLQKTLAGPFTAGAKSIDLAGYGLSLEPDVTYLWYLSLIPSPDRRSEDRVSGGAIEVLLAPSELENQLTAASTQERAIVLAGAGIWYDALKFLSERIKADPGDALARAQRAALLKQVGLPARL